MNQGEAFTRLCRKFQQVTESRQESSLANRTGTAHWWKFWFSSSGVWESSLESLQICYQQPPRKSKRWKLYVVAVNDLLTIQPTIRLHHVAQDKFLDFHLDICPWNHSSVRDARVHSHQNISAMERGYRGKWNLSSLSEYCWNVTRIAPEVEYKWKQCENNLLCSYAWAKLTKWSLLFCKIAEY